MHLIVEIGQVESVSDVLLVDFTEIFVPLAS